MYIMDKATPTKNSQIRHIVYMKEKNLVFLYLLKDKRSG